MDESVSPIYRLTDHGYTGKTQICVCARSVEPMPDLTQEDEAELASHRFSSEAGRVTANVLARCVRYTEKCDEQMTARMQRKNRQVCM